MKTITRHSLWNTSEANSKQDPTSSVIFSLLPDSNDSCHGRAATSISCPTLNPMRQPENQQLPAETRDSDLTLPFGCKPRTNSYFGDYSTSIVRATWSLSVASDHPPVCWSPWTDIGGASARTKTR